MNPIDELRAARPAHLGDDPVDERTRAAELSYAMSQPRQARRRRKVVRPVWGLGLAGAAAAVTAVAVVLAGNGAAPTPRAPDGGGRIATATDVPDGAGSTVNPDGSGSTASPGGTAAPRVTLSARDVLLAAAEKADRQPERTGDYWHTASVSRTLSTVAEGGYEMATESRDEMWTPSATGGEQWSRSQSLGTRPATAEDRKAWEAAGSPEKVEVAVPGKGGSLVLETGTAPGKVRTSHSPLVDGDKVFWLGRNVTMKDLRGLPSDPDDLKKWLLRSYEGHDTESSSTPMASGVWLFKVSAGLITDMPVTPQVRGAAFRMLAELDTVKVIENVTDAQGRQGTAVSIEERIKSGAVLENRLIFDESTGRALANENVVVKPGGLQAAFEPGEVFSSTAVLEAGWTDDKP
ncbi:CU044_5270 family protein [Nonomuraea turcica]|uniref:CU044_5270 family protein n=1 Tax=Nonomuraea sp. G32 TaxID=3067274 RepID=UPI00273C3D5B|nr:CU044_5270 family protein [Nonomuraea sp. G32]MDP4507316.1 CU044_5270 family protein [Nonomuraea sp. G32]